MSAAPVHSGSKPSMRPSPSLSTPSLQAVATVPAVPPATPAPPVFPLLAAPELVDPPDPVTVPPPWPMEIGLFPPWPSPSDSLPEEQPNVAPASASSNEIAGTPSVESRSAILLVM